MNLPDQYHCYRLFRETGMLDHIAAHSIQVCRVALFLTDHFATEQEPLDRDLIRASALLHDITKTRSLETGEVHAQTGADFVAEKGWPHVADLVRQHVRLDHYVDDGPVTAAEIVNYADKRVLHDRIATLPDRLAYIMERYGTTPERRDRIQAMWDETGRLERKLFLRLAFPPDELVSRITPPDCRKHLENYLNL